MLRRCMVLAVMIAAVITMGVSSKLFAADFSPNSIEGTWLVDVKLTEPPAGVQETSYKTLITFTREASFERGTLVETSWIPGGPSHGHGQGVWSRTGDREFTSTAMTIWLDPNETTLKARGVTSLSLDGTQISGHFDADLLAPDGSVISSGKGVLQGQRVLLEAPK